ncbi:hypothetical protein IT575_14390 [bacterium]|nr:hypothetical protein [bacterium]
MRAICLMLCLLSLLLFGCGSNGNNAAAPNSELTIEALPAMNVISSPDDRGAIVMSVGQQRFLRVTRTLRSTGLPDEKFNVTADVDVNFSDPDVAAFDANGRLTALEGGFTVMELVYRDDDLDPTDDDNVFLDINVTP